MSLNFLLQMENGEATDWIERNEHEYILLSKEDLYDVVSEIVNEIDYDIWKEIFLNDEEDCEESFQPVSPDDLVDILVNKGYEHDFGE